MKCPFLEIIFVFFVFIFSESEETVELCEKNCTSLLILKLFYWINKIRIIFIVTDSFIAGTRDCFQEEDKCNSDCSLQNHPNNCSENCSSLNKLCKDKIKKERENCIFNCKNKVLKENNYDNLESGEEECNHKHYLKTKECHNTASQLRKERCKRHISHRYEDKTEDEHNKPLVVREAERCNENVEMVSFFIIFYLFKNILFFIFISLFFFYYILLLLLYVYVYIYIF